MVYSSVAEERQRALQLGRALNSRPVSGKTCRMVVTGECRLATLLTPNQSSLQVANPDEPPIRSPRQLERVRVAGLLC